MEYLTFSAPGRVELGGNHTDHQHGCVLAAAIDRTARARVRPTGEGVVRVFSRGYAPVELAPDDLSPGRRSGTPPPPWSGAWPPPSGGGVCPGGDLTHGWSPTCCRAPASPAAPPLRCCWAA
ncbi:MAG: galactokinase family protein [Oscillospiraceae bacterium]